MLRTIVLGLAGAGLPLILAAPSREPQASLSVAAIHTALTQTVTRSGAEVGIYWRPLDAAGSDPAGQITIGGTTRFHAASTMKVPIMIELFRQTAAGRLTLDDTMLVTNTFTSIVDGTPYELLATEDSDSDVYKAIGQQRSYRQLCEAMITASSNLAANLLIERLGAKSIQQTVDSLGASGMQVLRGVEDQKAFDLGLNNTTDAVGLGTLMWKLGRGEVVSAAASADMVAVLARQKFNEGIPAGVPPGTRVAHKTGWITGIRHDAAIVYAPRPYVLVVLVRGIKDTAQADALIVEISRLVFPLGARVSAP